MNWRKIKADNEKVYPKNSITVFLMDTESGKSATCWVDKSYKDYPFKKFCMFNCFVQIDLTAEYNSGKTHDFRAIEDYFKNKLRENCVCHIIARITTDIGLNIEFYVDNVEKAIEKFNEIENDEKRLVDFNCEISDDETWGNVNEILK